MFTPTPSGILGFADRASQYIYLSNYRTYAQDSFYNKFISCLYMFRALCAHRQEVKIVLYQRLYNTILTS